MSALSNNFRPESRHGSQRWTLSSDCSYRAGRESDTLIVFVDSGQLGLHPNWMLRRESLKRSLSPSKRLEGIIAKRKISSSRPSATNIAKPELATRKQISVKTISPVNPYPFD